MQSPAPTPPSSALPAAASSHCRWPRLRNGRADDALALLARLAVAAVFFQSARTKVEGWLTISDSTYALFNDEYRLPLLSPEVAAQLATWAEHLFPALLVIGLGTRLSAFALLVMTAVIQLFVYPDAWSTHLMWSVPMWLLILRGGGAWSLDRRLGIP